jgi:hypothetical protein
MPSKNKQIAIRVTDAELALLEALSKDMGVGISTVLKIGARDLAKRRKVEVPPATPTQRTPAPPPGAPQEEGK